jgi:hypothetical protein
LLWEDDLFLERRGPGDADAGGSISAASGRGSGKHAAASELIQPLRTVLALCDWDDLQVGVMTENITLIVCRLIVFKDKP